MLCGLNSFKLVFNIIRKSGNSLYINFYYSHKVFKLNIYFERFKTIIAI